MKTERKTERAQEPNEGGETVGARIRARRRKIGMKQATLAQEAGISAAQLCHLEKSDVQPSIRTLERIADALGTTVGELLGEKVEKERRPEADEPLPGDALASDALARGGPVAEGAGRATHGVLPPALRATPLSEGSGPKGGTFARPFSEGGGPRSEAFARPLSEGGGTTSGTEIEPVTGLWRVHDARDAAVDRRVRARLAREVREWKKLERAAGVAGSATLPLFFPSAAEQGALLAREVRTAGGIGPAAAVDPVALLESKGFRVLETKLPAGLDSWSLWDPEDGNAFVFLREAATPERKRFRAAFELGHLARFVSGGCRPLRDIGASRKTSRAFAAALLLPEEAVREAAHGLAIGPEDWTWELVLSLKARFGVSAETFLYRIEELDLLSPARSRAFRAMLREHYARCRAAGRKDLEPAAPRNAGGRLGALRLRGSARKGTGSERETPLVPQWRMR